MLMPDYLKSKPFKAHRKTRFTITFFIFTLFFSFHDGSSFTLPNFQRHSSLIIHNNLPQSKNINTSSPRNLASKYRLSVGPKEQEDVIENRLLSFLRQIENGIVCLSLVAGVTLACSVPVNAQGDPAMYRQATLYKTVMDSGDEDFIASANKQLLDQVWGTIGTMYYDATGGMKFSPGYEWRQYWNDLVKERSESFKSVELTRKEVQRMIEKIQDPYAEYLSPDDIFGDKEAKSKKKARPNVGIQAVNQEVAPALLVQAVIPNSPAEKAGIQVGDYILSVGNWNANTQPELTQAEIDSMFSGDINDEVEIQIEKAYRKKGESRVQNIVLKNTQTETPAVTTKLLPAAEGSVGYIRIHYFNRVSTDELISILRSLQQQGVSRVILDLRNNLGGVIQEAFLSSSLFFKDPKTALAYTMNSRGQYSDHDVEESFMSQRSPGCIVEGGKIIILTNKGTASSAEVFTAALHDNGRATVVGDSTFGKSLIQHFFPLPDGGTLKLTVAEYLTPKQRHLIKNDGFSRDAGIRPDIFCISSPNPENITADECLNKALNL